MINLNLLYLESHSPEHLVIADISEYGNANISTPTIEITPPGYPMISLEFVAQGIQIYNSTTLGITPVGCANISLPDGLYKIKYSIYPAHKYFVNKTFLRVDKLVEMFDKAYLKLDISQCDTTIKNTRKNELDLAWSYINGAIASANNCADKQAMELYQRAYKTIKCMNDGQSCM